MTVRLVAVDEVVLEALVAVAVAASGPDESAPPVAGGGPGWTVERVEGLRAYHRARRSGLDGPAGEVTRAVTQDGVVLGAVRLEVVEPGPVLEVGLWLAGHARGRGIGAAALGLALEEARRFGAGEVVAETTMANHGAQAVLRRFGFELVEDPATAGVHARLVLGAAPGGG